MKLLELLKNELFLRLSTSLISPGMYYEFLSKSSKTLGLLAGL
jgi:hypothetical protein